jgi:hypothetical protein
MKTSSRWDFRSIVGKIMMGLALAAMIGSINVGSSFGEDNHDRGGKHDNGRYEQKGRGHDRDRHVRGRREYRPEGYGGRGYAPPPVVYEPPSPPGISIFFPPLIFH